VSVVLATALHSATIVGIAIAVAAVVIAFLFREEIGTRLETAAVTLPPPVPVEAPAPEPERPAPKAEAPPELETAPAEEAISADLIRQLRAGQLDEARATFDRLHSGDDDPEARERNSITFEFWRWRHGGDARGLDALDARRKDPDVGGLAERLIAEGHAETGHTDLAVRHFERAITSSKRPDDLVAAVRGLAKSLTGLGRRNDAAALLSHWVNQSRDDDQRRELVEELSGIYGEGEKWLYRAAALEVALETEPDNAARRFDAAFAYSQAGREDLALLHYLAALEADSDHRPSINNLGVAYERLGMGMKAVTEYKRAAELGESLGKANLGLSFLNAGFRAEAEAILHDAMQDPKAHESVSLHLASIRGKVDRESADEEAALHSAGELREFFRRIGHALTEATPRPVGGGWTHGASTYTVRTDELAGIVTIEFGEPKRRIRLSGHRTNNAVDVRVERQEVRWAGTEQIEFVETGTGMVTIDKGELNALLFEHGVPPRIERFLAS
jgi:tetratricopeptide (TPR) repeat protein